MMSFIWFGLGGFLLGLSFLGDIYLYAGLLALPCFFMSWLTKRVGGGKAESVPKPDTIKTRTLPEVAGTETELRDNIESIKEARKKRLLALEEDIDQTMFDCLSILQNSLESHSLCVFFPGKVSGMYLRVWLSHADSIIPGAALESGQGLVGLLLKEGHNRVLEKDIVADSTQLHYYSKNEKIRSIAGVPIVVNGVKRGAVVVDSLKPGAFDSDTIKNLAAASRLMGQFMYHAYASFENSYQRHQLAALNKYQRKFFENMSVSDIISYLDQYVDSSLEVDRLTLLERLPGTERARVLFCRGIEENKYSKFEFDLADRGLVNLVFAKNQVINRSFSKGERIPRMSPEENFTASVKCLMAVPVRTDQGTTHVLMVESIRRRWYTDHQKELLQTIAGAAGFALSRARMYEEKEIESKLDGLTGLTNRKTFHDRYEKEIRRATTLNYKVCALMLDIDLFKSVNDNYGHPVGDVVLKEVAKIISRFQQEEDDIVARYGGEEFVVLFVNCDVEQARDRAEAVREAVSEKDFDIGGGKILRVTISAGGACFPEDSKYGGDLLEKADKSLYHAKNSGRNRVVFYSDS